MNAETESERLIIFTRYPKPGKAKTRLIPALGAAGAALLQQQMTEYTLSQATKVQRHLTIEIRFAGGELSAMQNWLGSELIYKAQGEGDLGARMKQALFDAFDTGCDRVTIIGTDCPALTSDTIAAAFQQLHQHHLVIGPAIDGGYYLIGVNHLIPELFQGINWGSDTVFAQTINIAKKLNLSIAYLPTLADIDRPEDLALLQQSFFS